MGLSISLLADIRDRILHNSEATCSEAAERNAIKICSRYGRKTTNHNDSDSEEEEEEEEEEKH